MKQNLSSLIEFDLENFGNFLKLGTLLQYEHHAYSFVMDFVLIMLR